MTELELAAQEITLHRRIGAWLLEKAAAGAIVTKNDSPVPTAIAAILAPLSTLSELISSTATAATTADADDIVALIEELAGALGTYADAYGGIDDADEPDAALDESRRVRAAPNALIRESSGIYSWTPTFGREVAAARRTTAPNCLRPDTRTLLS